jgi:DNA polymerase theta
MIRKICKYPNKKILYLVPLKTLENEKCAYYQKILEPSGIRVTKGVDSVGNFEPENLIVCTYERGSAIINTYLSKLEEFSMVIIDELHMIADKSRGQVLEIILTKLKYCSSSSTNLQIIGLSATLPNIDVLADWIGAHMFITNYE